MKQNKKLLVGFDLSNDYSQIACFSYKTLKPISIYQRQELGVIIPTVLHKNESDVWTFGEEAIENSKNEKGDFISDILSKVYDEKKYKYGIKTYSGIDLLEKFFRRSLSLLKTYFPGMMISNLVITIKETDKKLINAIHTALGRMGIMTDRAKVISHSESYIYYALNMKQELWINDVALFDYSIDGFKYYQISINRRTSPMIAAVIKKDYSNIIDSSMKNINISYTFENVIKKAMYKQLISTVYFTGLLFEDGWANEIIKEVCQGRKVFLGQNLYVKGACYCAREFAGEGKLKNILILSSEKIIHTVSLMVHHDKKYREVFLLKEPTHWQEIDNSIEVILDEQEEIEFFIKNFITREKDKKKLILEGLPKRPNKMTRILIELKSKNESNLYVKVSDLGFGEMYPKTGMTWESELWVN